MVTIGLVMFLVALGALAIVGAEADPCEDGETDAKLNAMRNGGLL
jgi:hypothetical protein